jgi:hypothetical protein
MSWRGWRGGEDDENEGWFTLHLRLRRRRKRAKLKTKTTKMMTKKSQID